MVEIGSKSPSKIAAIILAKDEQANIGRMIDAIAGQTLCDRDDAALTVYVVANGCTDRTAEVARCAAATSLTPRGIETEVFDWPTPGKSRSWNRVIHEVIPNDVDYILAIDADISFADANVFAALFDYVLGNREVEVVSGFPIKDVEQKERPSLIDRFSMMVSRETRHAGVINGSLYLARSSCLREIWLPNETPGEDGFLNAMVMTRGFSHPERANSVGQLPTPTHYFEAHSPADYFAHERRMIVGTMINRWIFEHLHSLRLSNPAGPLIERLNREQPDWVERLIEKQSSKLWVIPGELIFRRLRPTQGLTARYLLRLPMLFLATALTVPPAFRANRTLKKRGAAAMW